jgi:hypothetical protein
MSLTLTTRPRIKVVEKANDNHPGPGGPPLALWRSTSLAIYRRPETPSIYG